jgi:hypothetical protein
VVIAGVLASGCGRGMLVHPYVVSAVNSRVDISVRSSSLIGVVFFRLMSEMKPIGSVQVFSFSKMRVHLCLLWISLRIASTLSFVGVSAYCCSSSSHLVVSSCNWRLSTYFS